MVSLTNTQFMHALWPRQQSNATGRGDENPYKRAKEIVRQIIQDNYGIGIEKLDDLKLKFNSNGLPGGFREPVFSFEHKGEDGKLHNFSLRFTRQSGNVAELPKDLREKYAAHAEGRYDRISLNIQHKMTPDLASGPAGVVKNLSANPETVTMTTKYNELAIRDAKNIVVAHDADAVMKQEIATERGRTKEETALFAANSILPSKQKALNYAGAFPHVKSDVLKTPTSARKIVDAAGKLWNKKNAMLRDLREGLATGTRTDRHTKMRAEKETRRDEAREALTARETEAWSKRATGMLGKLTKSLNDAVALEPGRDIIKPGKPAPADLYTSY